MMPGNDQTGSERTCLHIEKHSRVGVRSCDDDKSEWSAQQWVTSSSGNCD